MPILVQGHYAEEVGLEPTRDFSLTVFKTAAHRPTWLILPCWAGISRRGDYTTHLSGSGPLLTVAVHPARELVRVVESRL